MTTTTDNGRHQDGEASRLPPRAREILLDIIRTYTLSGEPVSSRTVSKHPQHGLSSASIRNVMADLEELGFLLQPHTSAGRVPTAAAYRLYVESLIETSSLSAEDRRRIDEALFSGDEDGDRLMGAAGRILSDLSQQVAVVVRPQVEKTVLKAVDFIPLEGRRVLCVVVSTGGFVDNLVIETDEPMARRDLIRISNYLTEHFAGVELREIRDRLLAKMAEERLHVDRWLAQAIDLAQRTVAGCQTPDVLVEGTTALFGQPEVRDVESIRRILDTFADKARLVRMLSSCLESEGLRVYIGDEHEVTSELDFSLVATSYGIGQRAIGSLGILGPARMEYPRIVALVRYLGETVSRTLTARC